MNSFYGGKKGSSFIIAKTYTTVEEMVADFGKNNSNCEVDFDEYVLINTVNKNNPENGQIYRRSYNYNDDTRKIISYHPAIYGTENPNYEEKEITANGAVYIGTIVGPAGRAPEFSFGGYTDLEDRCKVATNTFYDLLAMTASNPKRSDVIKKLNGMTVVETEENGNIKVTFNGEEIDDFYSLKLTNNDASVVHYYCYDRKYKINTQNVMGWFSVDLPPRTSEGSFHPGENLFLGVSYSYDAEGNLEYDTDEDGKVSIKKGVNRLGNTYQDTIDWNYCTVRNENLEDSTAYVGFRFGAPVVEFEAETVSAYENRSDMLGTEASLIPTNKFENLNLIKRDQKQEDIEAHPFYSKWKVSIPKGIKGDSIKRIYLVDAAKEHNIEKFILKDGELTYDEITGEIQVEPYVEDISIPEDMVETDILSSQEKWVIVFDYVCYDRISEGEKHTIYLGDFNQLDDITLEHWGQLVFDYTHDNTARTPQENWIHWIDKMEFNDDGTVIVTFNDNSWNLAADENQNEIKAGVLTKPQLINWITNMEFSNNGTVDVMFNNNNLFNGQLTKEQLINWITDAEFLEDGTINVMFNNNNLFNGKLTKEQLVTWMTDFSLDEDNGTLVVNFNNNRLIKNINKTLQWVKDIDIDDYGTITTDYTNINNKVQTKFIKWIKDMKFDEDGTVTVVFNNDNLNTESIKNGRIDLPNFLKWITAVNLDESNGKFTMDFNYEEKNGEKTHFEKDLTWLKYFNVDNEGNVTYTYTYDAGDSQSRIEPHAIKWIKDISLNDQDGHFIVNFNYTNEADANQTPTQINQFLTWIKNITIDNDGTVGFKYTTSKDDRELKNLINWIKSCSFADNGDFKLEFNNSNLSTIEKKIKWINDVVINSAEGENQQVKVTYNDGTVKEIGQPLNYVQEMTFDPRNGNILVLYSDPKKRGTEEYNSRSDWKAIGQLHSFKTLSSAIYDGTAIDNRVADLIPGSICYRLEDIE